MMTAHGALGTPEKAARRVSDSRLFGIAGLVALFAVAAFLVEVRGRFGGDAVTVAATDIGEASAALVAAAACAYASRRNSGRLRVTWTLLAMSAVSWCLGQTAWSVSDVVLGTTPTSPWLSDVGYLASYPFAIAGILALPMSSSRANRGRALLDGAIAAGSLVSVAWALGLDSVYSGSPLGDLGRVVTSVYPALDLVLITLLVLVVRRSIDPLRTAVAILLVAFLANFAADSLYTYSYLGGTYGTLGSLFDTGWVIGYLLIAVAAFWPTHAVMAETEEAPVEPWQLALPWLGVVAVMAAAGWASLMGRPIGTAGTAIAIGVGVLFVISQGLLLGDTVRLLRASRTAEARAKETTELLNEVMTQAPSGIARVGLDLRVLDANPKICSILRMDAQKVIGSSVADYVSSGDLLKITASIAGLTAGRAETVQGESEVHRPDGTNAWMLWTVTVVRRPDASVDYFIAMLEDISAKHQAEESARANLEASERLNQLKSEFMSMVSHEFRTALTGIQGYSEMMSTQDVSAEEVRKFSGDIYDDALRLDRMITQMLDLDRIESGRIALQLGSIDLNAILRSQVERAQVTTSRHVIKPDLDASLRFISGDADRIVQVVANLLSNAVKYSPEGGPIVVTSRLEGEYVRVSVRDHGSGIQPEFKDKIFGRYQRYQQAGKKQVVGTGLGLAIAQQIIQLHGGRIWVDSTPGEGSDFQFTLPVAPARARGESGGPQAGEPAAPAVGVAAA